jgi:hypothetical protein
MTAPKGATREGFVGGLYIPGSNPGSFGMDIGLPWIRLIPTEQRCEFHVRLGLHRFFGPWTIDRRRVTNVFRVRSGLTFPWSIIRIEVGQDLRWTFSTYQPAEVLQRLEALGYPVDRDFR